MPIAETSRDTHARLLAKTPVETFIRTVFVSAINTVRSKMFASTIRPVATAIAGYRSSGLGIISP
jgi:hypothetical protein